MNKISNKHLTKLIAVSGVLTFIIMGVMNFIFIPAIESTTQGLRCFDMNSFGYTYAQAREFVFLLTPKGRNIYLHFQLPLDFIFPIVYLLFFCSLFKKLGKGKALFYAFPVLLAIFDYFENICTIFMLTCADFGRELVMSAGTATRIKSVLMVFCIFILTIFIIEALIKKHRNKLKS